MGFGHHRPAHHCGLALVHQSPCEVHRRARNPTSENVGCRYGATGHNDEIYGGVFQQSERTRTTARRSFGQCLPSRHRHFDQREHRHLPRNHPKQHQHPVGHHRHERQHHLFKQPAAVARRQEDLRWRNETLLLQVPAHQNRPRLWLGAIFALQRVADLHGVEGSFGGHD